MREMGQSAWLNTSPLTLQGLGGTSQREREGKAVGTGYYVPIFILFGLFQGKKWRHSGRIDPLRTLNDARTKHGTRRVSMRLGGAGGKNDFFSILLRHLESASQSEPARHRQGLG